MLLSNEGVDRASEPNRTFEPRLLLTEKVGKNSKAEPEKTVNLSFP